MENSDKEGQIIVTSAAIIIIIFIYFFYYTVTYNLEKYDIK